MKYEIHVQGYCRAVGKLLHKTLPWKCIKLPARVLQIQYEDLNIIIDAGYGSRLVDETACFPERIMRLLTPFSISHNNIQDYRIDEKRNMCIYSHYHVDHVGNFDYGHVFECFGSVEELSYVQHRSRFQNMRNGYVKGLLNTKQQITPIESFKRYSEASWCSYFEYIYQFEEYPIYFVSLFGHSYKQYGVLIPELKLFYIADAVYSVIELHKDILSPLLKMIAVNKKEATITFMNIKRFVNDFPEYEIITNHDWR